MHETSKQDFFHSFFFRQKLLDKIEFICGEDTEHIFSCTIYCNSDVLCTYYGGLEHLTLFCIFIPVHLQYLMAGVSLVSSFTVGVG